VGPGSTAAELVQQHPGIHGPRDARAMDCSLRDRFHAILAASSLLPSGCSAELMGAIQAGDAIPYVDEDCVTRDSIKVGDAGMALDPPASSGPFSRSCWGPWF
jgi:hypothetical protein